MAYTEKYVTTTGTEAWATNSISNPSSITEAAANATGGQRVNILKGTYTLAANLTLASGTNENPIIWRGYNSTIGDLEGVGRPSATAELTHANFPLIDGGASYNITTGAFNKLINISATCSKSAETVIGGTYVNCWRCRFENTGGSSACGAWIQGAQYGTIEDCDATMSGTGNGVILYCDRGTVVGNRVWNSATPGSTQDGIALGIASCSRNVIFNVGVGVRCVSGTEGVHFNTIHDVVTGIKIVQSGTGISGNLIYSCTGYAFGGSDSGNVLLHNNAAGALTSGRIDTALGSVIEEINAVTLTADPFTASGSNDYTLNNTAGGGALCRAASKLWGGFSDLGAVQHDDAGGGGGLSAPLVGGCLIGR